MKCEAIRPGLLDYYFGEVQPDTRREIEGHLPACPNCLCNFLSLKREVETADLAVSPSAQARGRLRHEVARRVAPRSRSRQWSWWERPAAFGLAAAAVACAVFLLQSLATSPGTMPHSLQAAAPSLDQVEP